MIGTWLAEASGSRFRRGFATHFGVADFHTHLRLAWLEDYRVGAGAGLCELGCGSGVSLIELLLRNRETTAVGFEVDAAAVTEATALARQVGLGQRLEFRRYDLAQSIPAELRDADYVLLLDVLEHLPHPEDVAAAVAKSIRPGTRVLVSVPTPLYPKVFGRTFHTLIGHLHDGFCLEEIDRFFEGLERVRYRRSTGPLTWIGVLLYYRIPWQWPTCRPAGLFRRAVGLLATVLSLPFRMFDFWNGARISCSLFVEYRKPG